SASSIYRAFGCLCAWRLMALGSGPLPPKYCGQTGSDTCSIGRERWINPSNVSVSAAVNHIHAPMSSMSEHNYVGLCQIELHDSLPHAHRSEVFCRLRDHRRGEILVQHLDALGGGKHIGGVAILAAIDVPAVILELALVAPQALF